MPNFKGFARSLMLLALCTVSGTSAETNVCFTEDFSRPLGDRWKPVEFHAPTEYQIVTENSNSCLKARAQGSCSALAAKLELRPNAGLTLSWRWKIDRCPTNGSDDKLATFDHAARVFVAFDSFGPPRTINYVWANHVKTNSTFNHPYSSRARFIAVQTGNARAGQWLSERRDLKKDWEFLFKGERMPKITGIGVFTDSQSPHGPVIGWYDDIVLRAE